MSEGADAEIISLLRSILETLERIEAAIERQQDNETLL